MAHNHDHSGGNYGRAFAIGVGLNLTFVVAEFIFGAMAHSLSLIADAGHNFSDVIGLLLSWGAVTLSRRKPSSQFTYGWRRSSILAALLNSMLLFIALGGVAWEAIKRFGHPEPVVGTTVMAIAFVGILINGATAFLFMSGQKHDLNLKSAFLHMASDAVVSLGVVIAGAIILKTGWLWLDPAVSLVIAAVILVGTWGLFRDSMILSLDGVPEGIDTEAVRAYLIALPEIEDVHDLHIWAMSTTEAALTAHLISPISTARDALTDRITAELHDKFGIEHATLQLEESHCEHACCLEVHPAA